MSKSRPRWKIERDGIGFGVTDDQGIFENEHSMSFGVAKRFKRELEQAHQDERNNERYWQQASFGE